MSAAVIFDLQPFCDNDRDSSRYGIQTPFVHHGYRYATDGRICVRVPAPGEPSTSEVEPDRRVPINGLTEMEFITERDARSLKPWPEAKLVQYDIQETASCCACGGHGVERAKAQTKACPDCGLHVHFGPNCERCNGTGEVPSMVQKFGGVVLSEWYISLIAPLPNVEWIARKNGMLAFRSGDLYGVVMGMKTK